MEKFYDAIAMASKIKNYCGCKYNIDTKTISVYISKYPEN
jgi:hypothetical protein